MKRMPKIRRLRKLFCLDLAESIEVDISNRGFDVDRIARLIEVHLPTSVNEALIECEQQRQIERDASPDKEEPKPKSPSMGDRLRLAAGAPLNMPLNQILELVIAKLERVKSLTQGGEV